MLPWKGREEQRENHLETGNWTRHCTNNFLSCLKLMSTEEGAQRGTVSPLTLSLHGHSLYAELHGAAASDRLWSLSA